MPPARMPPHLRRRSPVARRFYAEARLQRVAVSWLRTLADERGDILSFHVPNEVYADPKTGARRKREGVEAGVADIVVLLGPPPLTIFIELKVQGRKQSKAQQTFESTVAGLGYTYHLLVCEHEFEVVPQLKAILLQHGYET